MVLVDTSAWIEFIRLGGDSRVEQRVRHLLLNNLATWWDLVQLELWNGAGSESDRKLLRQLQGVVRNTPTDDAVWARSRDLARKSRSKGTTVPASDILIAACAFEHDLEIESVDRHFTFLARFR